MKTLKQIHTINIQSHKDVVIDLPKTGLVRFSGLNSNGKSVITKTTVALISGRINSPKVRNTLINNKAIAGEIHYVDWDDNKLIAHIEREARATYVELTMNGQEPLRRYLADKTWLDLVYQFGFVYNKDREIPLQVVDDDQPLLFLATSDKVNSEVINTAISDEVAATALMQFDALLKEVSGMHVNCVNTINYYNQSMTQVVLYDTDTLQKDLNKYTKLLNSLAHFYIPDIPKLPDMSPVYFADIYEPNIPELPDMSPVKFYDISYPEIPNVVYPTLYDIHCDIPDILPITKELETLRAGVCPTCGKAWVD